MELKTDSKPRVEDAIFEKMYQANQSTSHAQLNPVLERDCLPFPEMGFDFDEIEAVLEKC